MQENKKEKDYKSTFMLMTAAIIFACLCYYRLAPELIRHGADIGGFNRFFAPFTPLLKNSTRAKGFIALLIACAAFFRTGKKVEASWNAIASYSITGFILFFIPFRDPLAFSLAGAIGMSMAVYGTSLIKRKMSGEETPDDEEGFQQTDELIETKDSINIPYDYTYHKKLHHGWINCVNPFRASIILGAPGSGKSFAIYNAFIEQTIRKGYTMFLYDYKFPDLTQRVLQEIAYQTKHEGLWSNMEKKPHLYIINFDDPTKSNRCNPIHHSYITDPADTTEIADLVFKNINKGSDGKGFDFFNESAKVYLDGLIFYLANYDPDAIYESDADPENGDPQKVVGSRTNYVNKGRYCTFPHVIELMACDYQKVFQILQYTKGLEAKISPFANALAGNAMEQLQGQIASAQIPLGKFVSPALYWVMTSSDFTLDINNPEDPKIVCMGNNPDRQSIYGTTLALYTSRMFKLINHKHKLKSVVLLDELPTIFIKGLDNLIATARSNKVAIALGAQDKSQLRRDYGDKEAEVIFTTAGNLFSGSVDGRTAEDISKSFGKQFRRRVSTSKNEDSTSQSISYQLEDILPASKIIDLSQGNFCGWVKDNFGQEIKDKKYCGLVKADLERNKLIEAEDGSIPMITNIFGDRPPKMDDKEKERLEKIHPNLAGNSEALQKIYINEEKQKVINANFQMVKDDVKELVKKEVERTEKVKEWLEARGEGTGTTT